jgi:hypothetical protein
MEHMKEKLRKNWLWVLVLILVVLGISFNYKISTSSEDLVVASPPVVVQSSQEKPAPNKGEPKVKRVKPTHMVEVENKPEKPEVAPEKPTKYKKQLILDGDEPIEYLESLNEFNKLSKDLDNDF